MGDYLAIAQNIVSAGTCLLNRYQAERVPSGDRYIATVLHVTVYYIILDLFLQICAGRKHVCLHKIVPLWIKEFLLYLKFKGCYTILNNKFILCHS
jgi:hypothetical protein